ncbi:MAG: hypothetical protein GY799_19910 [Desulfobulbaceae bacterium]|nr:hypothetical protein [Desulfobulbaceae bacterium]
MAYDIHIDLEKYGKSVSEYQFGFPEEIHEQLFRSECFQSNELQFIKRMSDYYRDSKYKGAEIEGLLQDLNWLIAEFSENENVANTLCELKSVCKKALEIKGAVVGYCGVQFVS